MQALVVVNDDGQHEEGSFFNLPPTKINMSPKKGPFQQENSSSNHWFSWDMLLFGGVLSHDVHPLHYSCKKSFDKNSQYHNKFKRREPLRNNLKCQEANTP